MRLTSFPLFPACSFLFLALLLSPPVRAGEVPFRLRCDYLTDPVGLDTDRPRLTWQLQDTRMGAKQLGYELVVGTDSLSVQNGSGRAWQTGYTASDRQLVPYAGAALEPFTRYYWSVRVRDENGQLSPWAKAAPFETGMMQQKNWKGAWVSDGRSIHEKRAPYFRKSFSLHKKVRSARAYIAAAGLYELSLNGKTIGDHRLDPGYTRFDRRVLYVTHDVTSALRNGSNAVGVLLGNGWYNHQSTAVWNFHDAPWRARPAFCLDLRITYDDGTVEIVSSGKDWKTSLGPLVFNSIYTAEHYDARLEQKGWNEPGFADTAWGGVIYRAAPAPLITAQVMHPIRNVEWIASKTMKRFNDTTYVFDLGRNISGVSRIRVTGERGTVLRLKHAERLYGNGRADQSNIDVHYRPRDGSDPFQTDLFILKGEGVEEFMPRFNYKGFQYVEVTASRPVRLQKESLSGYFMHSDVPPAGTVQTSSPLVNSLWWATNNSYLSNLFGYPTDCPQREKNGWTGDAHIAVETGLYNFESITVYEKWMADHRDEQQPNGTLPSIIPTGGWGYEWGNGPDWTSTIALIPWNIYLFYGDTSLLSACYSGMKRYVDGIDERYPSGLTSWGLGDWVPVKSKTPVEFTSTAYYFVDAEILAKTANVLGRKEDALRYARLAEKIRDTFNRKYLDPATAVYGSGLQTELSVPLQWGLVPDAYRERVAGNLAKRVVADSSRIDVGLLGTKAILNALSENGHANLAYTLASRKTYPSWGWWIANGATTLYENWPIDAKSDISLNHIMFGEIGAWFYKALAGIRPDPEQPGFRNIRLEPHFVDGLNACTGSHESPYGTIRSSWKKEGKRMRYSVTIPPGSTASLCLPGAEKKKWFRDGRSVAEGIARSEHRLTSGTYTFEWR